MIKSVCKFVFGLKGKLKMTQKECVEEVSECCGDTTCCLVEKVRERAYQLWQQAGEPDTDGSEFWFDAEAELAEQFADALTSGECTQE